MGDRPLPLLLGEERELGEPGHAPSRKPCVRRSPE
jgi:hypothetical protein